jgi:hypothetical protein
MANLLFQPKRFIEGTDYLGRVLLSMNLIPHENPEKGVAYINGYNEPEATNYILRPDIYEVEGQSTVGDVVWVTIKFGANEVKTEKLYV